MGVGTRQNRLAAGLFGGLAMAVQALLPLLLAAEIRLADAGEMPVCAPAGAEEALGPITHRQHSSSTHHHGGMAACPICQTAACGHAFADTAAAPALPAPLAYETAAGFAQPPLAPQALYSSSYRARAPPALG
jgi:hypothetical protein